MTRGDCARRLRSLQRCSQQRACAASVAGTVAIAVVRVRGTAGRRHLAGGVKRLCGLYCV